MRNLFFLLTFSFFLNSHSQNQKRFQLLDAENEKPVAFANVLFNNLNQKGTTSDIDGVFYIPNNVQNITISYVGFETKILNVNDITSSKILLKPEVSALDEVVLDGENPAHRIIKLAAQNKDLNNPNTLESYSYNSYDKIIFTSKSTTEKKDSMMIAAEKIMKGSYFFITETISKHKYLKPRLFQDSIIATKTSGFKQPNFALLASGFQPFSFYDEHIELFETNYLNPISKGSTRKYKFRLKEEIIKDNDTLFIISFEPKSNRNFEALKGILTINSNKYAVQSVDAETVNSGKIAFKIQQKYNLTKENYWFPEQLNFEMVVGTGPFSMAYVGKSYISDIDLSTPLTSKDFSLTTNIFSKELAQKDDGFWNEFRRDTLDYREKRTYVFIDSIGELIKMDKVFSYIPKLSEGRIPLKYVDIDLNQLYKYNKYEGSRLGLGLYTNEDISKTVSVGGYGAYGFKDHTWKYGGEVLFDFSKEKDFTISLKYKNDVVETGDFTGNRINNILNQRTWLASQMDAVESYSITTNMKLFRNVDWSLGFNNSKVSPRYAYLFNNNGASVFNYTNSEFQFGLSYHSSEKITNMFGLKIREISDKPIINFLYAKGLNNVFDGEFNYNKFRLTLDHSFVTKGLGKTTYRLDLGYIDKSIPYGLLFTGEGSYDKDIPFVVRNYFQTATPYEFLSNKYASLFTTHNFGRLFNNKGNITPNILLHNNLGIGNLSQPENHQLIDFSTKDELFLETGLELQNILKLPMLEIGYFGIGVGAFYRYGYHNLDRSKDNFAFKYSLGFTFK